MLQSKDEENRIVSCPLFMVRNTPENKYRLIDIYVQPEPNLERGSPLSKSSHDWHLK